MGILSVPITTPLWFFRLTNTRLVDSIMDVCGVPQKDSAKKACLQIFARCSAPAPGVLLNFIQRHQRKRSSSVSQSGALKEVEEPDVITLIEAAVKSQSLPTGTAKRLEVFLTSGCSPLPANIDEALETILLATGKVRLLDSKNQMTDPRRLKRYEDIVRIVKSMKHLVLLMKTMGIGPIFGSKNDATSCFASRPLYLALDLGLRQKRKHFNGQLFFQAIVLPDNFFNMDVSEQDTNRKSLVGFGIKVAEGGRYDDLVRRYRPPGNFATTMFNYYTAAQIPMVSDLLCRCPNDRFVSSQRLSIAVRRCTIFHWKVCRAVIRRCGTGKGCSRWL